MTRDTGASEPVGTLITDNAVRQCADRAPGGSEPFSTYTVENNTQKVYLTEENRSY